MITYLVTLFTFLFIVLVILTGVLYICGKFGVFFGEVGQEEIVVIKYFGKAKRYICNSVDFWIEPDTGKVWKKGPIDPAFPNQRPYTNRVEDIYGLYWFGVWPFARKHTYTLHYNKFAQPTKDPKKPQEISKAYEIIPRDGVADSVFIEASHAIDIPGNETSENVPISIGLNLRIRVRNANTLLFTSRNWPTDLTSSATAVARDFIGKETVKNITEMQMEVPTGEKSPLMEKILALNTSDNGNPSVDGLYGFEIIVANFLGYSIDEPKNDIQRVAIEKYNSERKADAKIAEQKGIEAENKTKNDNIRARGEAERDADIARAVGVKALQEALKNNPEIVGYKQAEAAMKMAESVGKLEKLTSLAVGVGTISTIPIK